MKRLFIMTLISLASVRALALATDDMAGTDFNKINVADSKEVAFRDDDNVSIIQSNATRTRRDSVDSHLDRGGHGDCEGLGGGDERD